MSQRTRALCTGCSAWTLLVLLCSGMAAAADGTKGKSKVLDKDVRAQAARHGPGREGGIDPTTVPIVDDDMVFAIGDSDVFLGGVVREQLQVAAAHDHATGVGVVVAVVDGGFNLDHPALADHWLNSGYDAIEDDFDAHDTGNGIDDDADGNLDAACGHGTFVAAMVAAVAPDAWLLPVRVRDDEGWGTNTELVRGLEYAWAMGARIVNLSISAAVVQSAGLVRVIRAMRMDGIAFVVSLGNESDESQNNLAGLIDTLAVGAVGPDDHVASFSNYNLFAFNNAPVVYAPGVDLYGPLCIDGQPAGGWWSGTSFAAPIVSGAAALRLQFDALVEPLDLYVELALAVDEARGPSGEYVDGLGRINLLKVVTHDER